jgi:hypothetical protein
VLADVAPTVAGSSNISWTGWALEGILVLVVGALLLAALRFMLRATFDKLLATSKDTNAKVSNNGGNSRSIGDIAPRLEDKVERTEGKVDQLTLVVASFKSEAVTAATENRLAAATAERHAQAAATAAKDAATAASQAATGVARIEAHLGAQDTTIGLLAAALKTN